MQKERQPDWQETNVGLIGSDIDRKCKEAAANGEPQWRGAGEHPGLQVYGGARARAGARRHTSWRTAVWPMLERASDFRPALCCARRFGASSSSEWCPGRAQSGASCTAAIRTLCSGRPARPPTRTSSSGTSTSGSDPSRARTNTAPPPTRRLSSTTFCATAPRSTAR
eukprot:scaffold4200_cov124-Isochrysis_galbana.AAC.4